MAIKISGTTVIDDSRNITNLGSALTVVQGGTGVTTSTGTGATVRGTSPALTTPAITTGINDAANNEILKFTATGSAVNEVTLANAGTGSNPALSATGTDTNVGIDVTPKGTGEAHVTSSYLTAAFSDKVNALGSTGTSKTINVTSGTLVTATLTGNCTFTLAALNSIASRASSFTMILTNDATASRTVAFAGGTFKYPGGSVSRTTTSNAVDVWTFFTPDGGTTWYVNIPMKNIS
jgi:hypothetical protein